jgi:pilus assembly protein CpaF
MTTGGEHRHRRHDNVMLELIDGSLIDGPAVADSDEELIDFLVFLGSRSEVNARSFSEAQPRLHLRLDGGSRLAAAAWVTPRPSVVIRRHRLMQVTLDDLVARDMMTPVAASFLRAAVRARSRSSSPAPGRGQDHPGPRTVRRDR